MAITIRSDNARDSVRAQKAAVLQGAGLSLQSGGRRQTQGADGDRGDTACLNTGGIHQGIAAQGRYQFALRSMGREHIGKAIWSFLCGPPLEIADSVCVHGGRAGCRRGWDCQRETPSGVGGGGASPPRRSSRREGPLRRDPRSRTGPPSGHRHPRRRLGPRGRAARGGCLSHARPRDGSRSP